MQKTEYTQALKNVLSLGTPLLLGEICMFLHLFADTAMLGQLGSSDLAAISLASTLMIVLLVLSWPLYLVTRTLISRHFSENNKKLGQNLDSAILAAGIFAVAVFCISYPGEIFVITNSSPATAEKISTYISIIRFTLLLFPFECCIAGFFAALRKTKIILGVNISSVVINITLNYVLIFGKFSFPRLGIAGAAWGTVVSQIFIIIIYMFYLVHYRMIPNYALFTFSSTKWANIATIITKVIPVAIQNAFAYLIFLLYKTIIGEIDEKYLNITHVALLVFRMNKVLLKGYANSSAIYIAAALGNNKQKTAAVYMNIAIGIAVCVGSLVLVITCLFPRQIFSIFSNDAVVIQEGISAIRFFAFFFLIEIIAHPLEVIFSSNGWGHFVLIAEGIPITLFTLICTSVIASTLGKEGIYWIWGCLAAYQIVFAATLFWGYRSKKWLNMKIEL